MPEVRADENTPTRSDEQPTRNRKGDTRTLTSYLPLISAAVGNLVIVSSVVFFWVEDDMRRLVAVTFGLGFLTASVWFAANPIIRNTRRFMAMRKEVETLVWARLLNRQVAEGAAPEDIEGTRGRMHEAAERMVVAPDETS